MKNIAVIPARGGSKRIPRKNIKDFCGKPIIAYSIEAAIKSGCFEKVVVSTDDEEIAAIAKAYHAEVPFLRPKNIADDFSGTNAVVAHAVEYYENEGFDFDYVCCLYATAPFITSQIISQGLKQIHESLDVDYAVTVSAYSAPVQKAMYIDEHTNLLLMREPESAETRSQDLVECYHDVGQMYWAKPDTFKSDARVFVQRVSPVIIPSYRAQDIDVPDDWIKAEAMYKALV